MLYYACTVARRGYSSPCLLVRVLCSLSTASLCHHPYPLVIISGSRYAGLSQGRPKTGIHALTRIRDRVHLPYAGTSMPEVLTSVPSFLHRHNKIIPTYPTYVGHGMPVTVSRSHACVGPLAKAMPDKVCRWWICRFIPAWLCRSSFTRSTLGHCFMTCLDPTRGSSPDNRRNAVDANSSKTKIILSYHVPLIYRLWPQHVKLSTWP